LQIIGNCGNTNDHYRVSHTTKNTKPLQVDQFKILHFLCREKRKNCFNYAQFARDIGGKRSIEVQVQKNSENGKKLREIWKILQEKPCFK
jgi:hypothetical protein